MTRFITLLLAGSVLTACNPLVDSYADRHLESPTNTIMVPPVGFVRGNRSFNPGEEPAGAEQVLFTTDGESGYVVCQHFWTEAAGNWDWVLYDKPTVVGTNVDQQYGKAHCMAEGYRIKGGAEPQDLHPTTIYISSPAETTLGASAARHQAQ